MQLARIFLAQCHAVKLAQKIQVPPVAPELAVCQRVQADVVLALDRVADRSVLGFAQGLGVQLAALEGGAGGGQRGGPEQAADLVGAPRRACAYFSNRAVCGHGDGGAGLRWACPIIPAGRAIHHR